MQRSISMRSFNEDVYGQRRVYEDHRVPPNLTGGFAPPDGAQGRGINHNLSYRPIDPSQHRMRQPPTASFGSSNPALDEQRLSELAGRLGLLENQNRQTMEIVFGLKNQKNSGADPELATALRTNGEHIKQLHARFIAFEEALQTNRGREDKLETQVNAIQDVILSELGDPQKMESMKDLSRNCDRIHAELNELRTELDAGNYQGPKLQIQVMPDSDDGKKFVTLSELRKYIMMAADEMSSTMKTYLDDKIDTMEHDLSDIRKEVKSERKRNEALEARVGHFEQNENANSNRRSNSGQQQYSPELVKKRSFDQLVKEVDQCFSELGRQVQREAKGRANIAEQIDQMQANEISPAANSQAIDARIAKVEAALADLKKDTKKERKKIEKAIEAQANSGPDMTAVEDTIQSIITDVVEELTSNEARLYDSVERRMKDLEETVQSESTARSIAERKANSELRRVGALIDGGKSGLRRNSSAEETTKTIEVPVGVDELRVTVASLKEQLALYEEEMAENKRQFDSNNSSFKKDVEEFRKTLHKTETNEREIARKIEKMEKGLVGAQNAAPGRTVSIGPDTADVMSLKKQLKELETKMDKMKVESESTPRSNMSDNKLSPAIAKMNEQVLDLETSVTSLRNQVDADRNRLDNIRAESLGRIKAVREEVRSLKSSNQSSDQSQKGPKIDVLVSQDVLAKKSDAEITKEDLERIFDKIEKLESSTLPSGVSIGQTELMRELECMSDENQRLWRSLTKLEEEVKSCARVESSTSENNSPGALANAINQFQKQIGTPDLTGEVEIRLKKIERELSEKTDRGSDRLWRHLSNLEEQITRRHGENDERLSKLEAIPSQISKETDTDPQSENISATTTTEVNEKNSQLWKEIASLKSKMSEIIGRDLLDLKKKLNTSAQRADVRRIILDIENLKVEALSPMENKIKKLEAEISDLPKVNPSDLTSKKVPIGAPKVSVISDSNREEWERTLITKDDMKEFEEKLNKFRDYWVAESSKYAKIGMLEIFTDDLSALKGQVDDLMLNQRGTAKALEDRMELLAEDLEENMTSARREDKDNIERQFKTIEVNGVAAHVMEDLASLQHVVSKISAQLEMLKDTDASLTETPTMSEQTPMPFSETTDSTTASTVTQTLTQSLPRIAPAINKEIIIAEVENLVESKLKSLKPENQNEGLLKMVRERVSRLEDEVAIARKEEQTNCDNLKRQIFAIKDDLENRKPDFALPSVSTKTQQDIAPIREKLSAMEEGNAVLEKSILSLVTKMDSKIDGIESKCERTVKAQMALEEHVDNLEDRVTENQHGVTSVSTPSIPPAFFDLSPEIFDDKLELLTDNVKALISEKKILAERLDIVEEELETNDRFLIESITAEKAQEIAKRIAQEESKRLEEELKEIQENFKNIKTEKSGLKRNESEEIPKFIKSVSMGDMDDSADSDYKQIIDEVKEIAAKATKELTYHDEMFDLVQKRLQAIEAHLSEIPLHAEQAKPSDDHNSELLATFEAQINDLEKTATQNSKKSEKMSNEIEELRSKIKRNNSSLTRKLGDVEDEVLSEMAKIKILVESAKTQKDVQNSFDKIGGFETASKSSSEIKGAPISTQESFKLRNQIQDMWKSLRLDIAHRTASLEKMSKSELLNMRENLRQERKRTTKEISEVAEILDEVEKQVNFQRIDFEKEKAKETARRSIESQKASNQARDSEKRMRSTSDALANLITEVRDEQADDRIYMRAELKQTQTELRRQAMAFERVHGRQSRCENDVVDMNSKIKDLSRSFVNMATDSRATITNSFVKNSDSRSEISNRAENSGLLNYRSSFTEFSTDRLSENSSNA